MVGSHASRGRVRRLTFRDALNRDISKMPVASMIGVATKDSFSKDAIVASFRNTGLHPFNKEKIGVCLEKYLGAPTEKPALTAEQETIRLSTNIAKEAFQATTPIKKKTVRNAPAKSTMFTAEEMLAFDAKRSAEASKAKKSTSKKRKIENPPAPNPKKQKISEAKSVPREPDQVCWACGHSGRQTTSWEICDGCENILVCTHCKKESKEYHDHVRECAGEEGSEDSADDTDTGSNAV